MNQGNLILSNWRQQAGVLKENLAIIRKRSTKNAVHDLRVAIKKLRSYLRLKKKITGESWKEQFLNTSDLFSSFGRLRDFAMSLALARKYEKADQLSFISFKQYLSAKQKPLRRSAKDFALKYNENDLGIFDHSFNMISSTLSNDEICRRIIQLSDEKKQKVKKLDDHFRQNAHAIRKALKDIYYWLKIIPDEFSNDLMDLKELDKVLNFLGNWQDHFILKEKVKEYQKKHATVVEKDDFKLLAHKLAGEQKELLDRARKKWQELIKEKRLS